MFINFYDDPVWLTALKIIFSIIGTAGIIIAIPKLTIYLFT